MLLTIHHACCTGGSIVSQILASATNSILISEINPYKQITVQQRIQPYFDPTSILWHLVYNSKEISETLKLKYFLCQLDISIEHVKGLRKNLLLRDHTHSTFNFSDKDNFFMNKKLGSLFLEILGYFYESKSQDFDFTLIKPIISVRHPLDSFIAGRKRGWLKPYCGGEINLDNYCKGLLKFQKYMENEKSAKVIRYEDLCIDYSNCLIQTFSDLNIDYQIPSLDEINRIKVTGKSGRKTKNIALRERIIENVDNDLKKETEVSKYYQIYCQLNKYNPNYQDHQISKSI